MVCRNNMNNEEVRWGLGFRSFVLVAMGIYALFGRGCSENSEDDYRTEGRNHAERRYQMNKAEEMER